MNHSRSLSSLAAIYKKNEPISSLPLKWNYSSFFLFLLLFHSVCSLSLSPSPSFFLLPGKTTLIGVMSFPIFQYDTTTLFIFFFSFSGPLSLSPFPFFFSLCVTLHCSFSGQPNGCVQIRQSGTIQISLQCQSWPAALLTKINKANCHASPSRLSHPLGEGGDESDWESSSWKSEWVLYKKTTLYTMLLLHWRLFNIA